jgi:hypothetical protein
MAKETLHLVLKRRWFDMILSGDKKEEYREIFSHWTKRLTVKGSDLIFKNFNTVTFTNGYRPNSPRFTIECKGIEIRTGKPEWGAEPGKQYFVIRLGEVVRNG